MQVDALAVDELSVGTNLATSMTLNDLEPQNRGFSAFLAILGCGALIESKFSLKLLEIDQDNLRTKLY